MNRFFLSGLVALSILTAAGCKVQVVPGGGSVSQPPPKAQPQIVHKANIRTSERSDRILYTAVSHSASPGQVRICLYNNTKSGWRKRIELRAAGAGYYKLEANGRGSRDCATVPSNARIDLVASKAKALGIMTRVKKDAISLKRWEGHRLEFDWLAD